MSSHSGNESGILELRSDPKDVSLHQPVQTRIQSDPEPTVPIRQREVIQVITWRFQTSVFGRSELQYVRRSVISSLTTQDHLGEVHRRTLVSGVALQLHHMQEVPADGRRGRGRLLDKNSPSVAAVIINKHDYDPDGSTRSRSG